MINTLVIDVPRNEWLSSNSRLCTQAIASRTKRLRQRGRSFAVAGRLPFMANARVVYYVSYPSNRSKVDPANAYPTIKALLDGVVDAKKLPDDSRRHVLGPDPRWAPKHALGAGWHRVIIEFHTWDGEVSHA